MSQEHSIKPKANHQISTLSNYLYVSSFLAPGIPLGFPWDSPGIQDYFGACRAGVFQQDGFMASEEMVEHLLSADPGGLNVDSPWTHRGSKGI